VKDRVQKEELEEARAGVKIAYLNDFEKAEDKISKR